MGPKCNCKPHFIWGSSWCYCELSKELTEQFNIPKSDDKCICHHSFIEHMDDGCDGLTSYMDKDWDLIDKECSCFKFVAAENDKPAQDKKEICLCSSNQEQINLLLKKGLDCIHGKCANQSSLWKRIKKFWNE